MTEQQQLELEVERIAAEKALVHDKQVEAFDKAYWLAQPPEVRALRAMDSYSMERLEMAYNLAIKGFCVDPDIAARGGGNAFDIMRNREYHGWTWYPRFLQENETVAPGVVYPNRPSYDPTKPKPGSFKVSSKIEDYPPFDGKVEPPKAKAYPNFAKPLGVNRWEAYPGDLSPNGTVTEDGKYIKEIVAYGFTSVASWRTKN